MGNSKIHQVAGQEGKNRVVTGLALSHHRSEHGISYEHNYERKHHIITHFKWLEPPIYSNRKSNSEQSSTTFVRNYL